MAGVRQRLIAVLAGVVFVGILGAPGGEPLEELGNAAKEAAAEVEPVLPADVTELDGIAPLPRPRQPKSADPASGILFVRCTRLWAALPDGSQPHLVVDMTGISSPTFAPNARTVAFLVGGREIWMAAADGSRVAKLGDIASGGELSPGTYATNLTWSPDGRFLAFALVNDAFDMWRGGSVIWTLELGTGTFESDGDGWPVPSWLQKDLAYSILDDEGITFDAGQRYVTRKLNKNKTLLAATFNRMGWMDIYGRGVVMLRQADDSTVLLGYRRWSWSKDKWWTLPPDGYHIPARSQPAISQDASKLFVDLVDAAGDPSLGVVSINKKRWRIMDYAWDPETTPAPTATGPLTAKRALALAGDVVMRYRRPGVKADLILGSGGDRSVLPFEGWTTNLFGEPFKEGGAWHVPATVVGRSDKGLAYRDVDVVLRATDGRITGESRPRSRLTPVRTIDDAFTLVQRMMPEVHAVAPEGLPAGVRLARGIPITAYRWRGDPFASIHMEVPTGEKRPEYVTVAFGDVSLSIGCGGVFDPQDVEVAGIASVTDHNQGTRQVMWPATVEDLKHARFTIYGSYSRDELIGWAETMIGAGAR